MRFAALHRQLFPSKLRTIWRRTLGQILRSAQIDEIQQKPEMIALAGGEGEVVDGVWFGADFDCEFRAFVELRGDVLLVGRAGGSPANLWRWLSGLTRRSICGDADGVLAGRGALLRGHLIGAIDDLSDAEPALALGFEGDLACFHRLAVEGDLSGDGGAIGIGAAAADQQGERYDGKQC